MLQVSIDEKAVAELIAFGCFAAERGWVPATSGNFSRRLDARHIAVTRSGRDKGALSQSDFAVVALDEPLPPGVSAETPLHVARYRRDDSIAAIVHVHSLPATVLSRADETKGAVELEGFEMHKALEGFTTHESTLRIPIFANAQDTAELARRIETSLGDAPVPGYLLAGHGIYAWGASVDDARRHVEAIDFLLRCSLEERRIR
ncbi:MAG TPA: methylthioribulose 1-phosphate dehydratase [Candidatus Baltobacteraceae bacterium]|nr:methylthioribulose 1-phosphate dehydratase [Candidatus Baltobacteraceae bacterium]